MHGWAGNRTYWDHQVDYLAGRNFVIAVDLGGHGAASTIGSAPCRRSESTSVGDVALVGHSMGGDAIVHAARQLGDRLVGLVWVDVFRSLGNEPVSSNEQVEAFVAPFRADFEAAVARFVRNLLPAAANCELVDRITTDMTATAREVALGSLPYARNRQPPILAALADITAPLVAINPGIAPTDVDSLRQHGVEPIVLADVGHFPMLEDPEQFNPILATTLASFAGRARAS